MTNFSWFFCHPGNCGAGSRELGGRSGADHAHSAGSRSVADAKGGYVPWPALPAPHGLCGTGCWHPGHLWHLQGTWGQNQPGGCNRRLDSLLLGSYAIPPGAHSDTPSEGWASSEKRGRSPLLPCYSVSVGLLLFQWSMELTAHSGTPRWPLPALSTLSHGTGAGIEPADDFLHLQEHSHCPLGALSNLCSAVWAAVRGSRVEEVRRTVGVL